MLALLVSLAIAALLLVVVLKQIDLTKTGAYSGRQRALYATVCTIIASLLTTLIKAQIRRLWILQIDATFSEARDLHKLQRLNSKWRTILDVGSLMEMLKNWHVQLSFVGTTLVTTALVAGLTPTLTTRTLESVDITVSSAQLYQGINCAMATSRSDYFYSWPKADGGYVMTNPAGGGCPTRQAVTLMGNINIQNPTNYAYADMGVAVSPTAIGTPIAAYASRADIAPDLDSALEQYGSALQGMTLCVPVMKKSPVSCRVAGSMTAFADGILATSDNKLCSIRSNNTVGSASGARMAKGLCTHGSVGQATIVLAGTSGYAFWIATAIGDSSLDAREKAGTLTGAQFVVTCDVDTRDVYEFRNVTLRLQNPDRSVSAAFGRTLAITPDSSPCQPPANYGPDLGLVATTAVAPWQVLLQNEGLDGWFDSLGQSAIGFSAGERRTAPWAFNNSRNALDDVFGLVAALVGSRMNSTTTMQVPVEASITSTRIGTGHLWALVFVLPPLFAATAILVLLLVNQKSKPTEFTAVNLEHLLHGVSNHDHVSENTPLEVNERLSWNK